MDAIKRAWGLRVVAVLFMLIAASRPQGRTAFYLIGLAAFVASLRRPRASKPPAPDA